MDIAAGICASERAQCRTVTVALDGMHFIRPVKIGDILCVYTEIERIGNTSIDIQVEAWVQRDRSRNTVKVTRANFKFVALGVDGRPRPLPTD
jgi:acyl-CoA thioesterase YciA